MLDVMESKDVLELIERNFRIAPNTHTVPLVDADGMVLACDIVSGEFVPDFDRSTVDGYAVSSREVFGCSDAIPALLTLQGEIAAGEDPKEAWSPGGCFYVPTGGALPKGTDAMVMIEYAERFSDGTIAIYKPSAPGQHIIFRGDDIKAGDLVAKKGTLITTKEIGALSALGIMQVPVFMKPKIGIISTGDELVRADEKPQGAQIRDVNGPMLQSAIKEAGGQPIFYGIVKDEYDLLFESVKRAVEQCDMVILSGGTSVGSKDATQLVIEAQGEVMVHGIAIKPGKPTIVGKIQDKPVFGLPGHPLAAYFMYMVFVRELIQAMGGYKPESKTVSATLARTIPSNEGREECVPVKLDTNNIATPVTGKSGLITTLLNTHGYIRIERDCEGLAKGSQIQVILFRS